MAMRTEKKWSPGLLLCATVVILLTGCGGATPMPASVAEANDAAVTTDPPTVTPEPQVTSTVSPPTATELPATPTATDAPEPAEMAMRLTSEAFAEGGGIPSLYTCQGEDTSPPLAWEGVPVGTQSFALICEDPDAPVGIWVHWVLFDIPAEARELPAAVPTDATLSDGAGQGLNSWPRTGYGGPCPPSGTHRYIFRLYALDSVLRLAPDDTDKAALLDAMEGHVLGETSLTGLYARQ